MNMKLVMDEKAQLPLTPPTPATPLTPPTPPASPPPTSSLSAEINTATREQHVTLNRLIADLLPKALPPHRNDASTLAGGLVPFAQIFFAFENAWSQVPAADCQPGANPHHRPDLLHCLRTLRPPGLERTERLKNDMKDKMKLAGDSFHSIQMTRSKAVDQEKIVEKPHLLLAYAWVMYMAVFSGGRWIRSQLMSAETVEKNFWWHEAGEADKHRGKEKGDLICDISFLSFPEGTNDGEDIKRTFKARYAATEVFLTDDERREVVEAAVGLFTHCIAEVRQLQKEHDNWLRHMLTDHVLVALGGSLAIYLQYHILRFLYKCAVRLLF